MKQRFWFILIVAYWCLLLFSCKTPDSAVYPVVPDYSKTTAWFEGGVGAGKDYDIFYIVPTCVFDWQDENGKICHYMDVYNASHRSSVDGPLRLARGIFAEEANFFAPYYRQITIESWMESDEVIENRFETAFKDIEAAFQYYLKHQNQGRPFVLAGHSQGGKAVIELLKRCMNPETYGRMIAAYPLGYPVRSEDTSNYLLPATDAAGTGVSITFNSVAAPDRLTKLLEGSTIAINPLNWRIDTVVASKQQHLGMVFTAADGHILSEESQVISAYLDKKTKALVVSGVDPMTYYEPALAEMFPPGNYHIVELNFFYRNLQQNVQERAAAFLERQNREEI